MKRFDCPTCRNEVHFDSVACVQCASRLGYDPDRAVMLTLGAGDGGAAPALCRNAESAGCNWLAAGPGALCAACAHNNVVPDPGHDSNRSRWIAVERAKRRLFYALRRWNLPHPTRAEDPELGLAFDFLAELPNPDGSTAHVGTGHQDGLVTINIAEGDEVVRTERKSAMEEPYRTLIGHLRHEIGHYYWQMLVEPSADLLERCRALFGDERLDYGAALQAHYANGAPQGWQQTHISAYATAHPWEDFAETWAHWMHIVDGLETAAAYDIRPAGAPAAGPQHGMDPYLQRDIAPLVDAWVPLTVAINNMNRGMGQPDLYPFVLSSPVIGKLRFINDLMHGAGGGRG